MPKSANEAASKRVPLSRDRVLRAAVAIADAAGIGSLTMRSLAQELGVEPMALYYHVANKEEILDGIVDLVFSEIGLPTRTVTGAPRSFAERTRPAGYCDATPGRSDSWSRERHPVRQHCDTMTRPSALSGRGASPWR